MAKSRILNIPREIKHIASDELSRFRSWRKSADPRTINLFAGAAVIAPGFVSVVAGSMLYLNSNAIANSCAAQSTTNTPSALYEPNVCRQAFADRSHSKELIFGGGIAIGVPGLAFIWNDGRLAARQSRNSGSGRSI
ncbi:MAG: hypothetical protein U0R17_06595 [Acidimicrobiia bacterium]